MKNIFVVAKNTFKEAIRDRILYGIFAFAILFIASTTIFGSISLGEDLKIIKDFGLAGIYLFSIIIAIFLGTSTLYKEIERRTIYIILSKPIKTGEYILGKFFGLLAGIAFVVILMTIIYLFFVFVKGGGFDLREVLAILMTLPEIAIFISLALLFSTFSTPLASTFYATMLLFIGHSLDTLLKFGTKSGGFSKILIQIGYYLLPNLEKFNLRNLVTESARINPLEISYSILYAVFYLIIVLLLADWSLKKQEI